MSGLIHEKSNDLTKQIASCFSPVPPEGKDALVNALTAVRSHALSLAEHQWRKHKAPMAAYYKVVGVWCGHFARAIKKSPTNKQSLPPGDMAGYLAKLGREDLINHCLNLYEDNTRLRRKLDDRAGIIR